MLYTASAYSKIFQFIHARFFLKKLYDNLIFLSLYRFCDNYRFMLYVIIKRSLAILDVLSGIVLHDSFVEVALDVVAHIRCK